MAAKKTKTEPKIEMPRIVDKRLKSRNALLWADKLAKKYNAPFHVGHNPEEGFHYVYNCEEHELGLKEDLINGCTVHP